MTIDAAPAPTSNAVIGTEHAQRIAALRHRIREEGLAAVAVASPENIYYLTGLDHLGYFAFTLLVIDRGGATTVISRAMESPTIRAQIPWCRHVTFGEGQSAATAALAVLDHVAADGGRVALDDSMFFPPSVFAELGNVLRYRCVPDLLVDERAVKSPAEVSVMAEAAAISDAAMQAGLRTLRSGVAEREVAAEVYRSMIQAGGQSPGFPPLIRPTTLLDQEHITWSDRRIEPGQGVLFELSASLRRYHAPLSRTVYIGHAPAGAAVAASTALAGLTAARDALRPGIRTGEVYAAWERAVAGRRATGMPLRHHCGYLVGIGFPPSWVGGGAVPGIRPDGQIRVRAGMTFHLLSWVNDPVGHVISDTVLVNSHDAESLTTTPRELTVLRSTHQDERITPCASPG